MLNFEFNLTTPLNGYATQFGDTTVRELHGIAIVSVAKALESGDNANGIVADHYGASWPEPGKFSASNGDNSFWLGLSSDQCFALINDETGSAFETARTHFDGCAYCTEQTDSWAMLSLEGALSKPALERICPIDLDESAFPPGAVTRTVMEHLAVIIQCVGANRYVLLSPTSSAQSFLHAVETSFNNISSDT